MAFDDGAQTYFLEIFFVIVGLFLLAICLRYIRYPLGRYLRNSREIEVQDPIPLSIVKVVDSSAV